MKTYILSIAILISGAIGAQNANKIVKSKITKATVYLNGARIDRAGTLSFSAGITELVFSDLSSKIAKESIKAYASNGVKVVSINYEFNRITPVNEVSTQTDKLRAEIKVLNHKVKELSNKKGAYQAQVKILDYADRVGAGTAGMKV